jgi:hypothetical protein
LEDREKAVQCKIVATHLTGAKQAAGDWAELGRASRYALLVAFFVRVLIFCPNSEIGLLHQAIYCFTQAIKADKKNLDAMWDRAYLLKLSGATGMVRLLSPFPLPFPPFLLSLLSVFAFLPCHTADFCAALYSFDRPSAPSFPSSNFALTTRTPSASSPPSSPPLRNTNKRQLSSSIPSHTTAPQSPSSPLKPSISSMATTIATSKRSPTSCSTSLSGRR